jgi:hypothetical protein
MNLRKFKNKNKHFINFFQRIFKIFLENKLIFFLCHLRIILMIFNFLKNYFIFI